tara:strand:+ start:3485 stop:3793 length:309 start_codon:yes stop_codon:yes gene_type:complete
MKKTNKKGGVQLQERYNEKDLKKIQYNLSYFEKFLINFNNNRSQHSYESKDPREKIKQTNQQFGLIKNIQLFGNFITSMFEEDYNLNCFQNLTISQLVPVGK